MIKEWGWFAGLPWGLTVVGAILLLASVEMWLVVSYHGVGSIALMVTVPCCVLLFILVMYFGIQVANRADKALWRFPAGTAFERPPGNECVGHLLDEWLLTTLVMGGRDFVWACATSCLRSIWTTIGMFLQLLYYASFA